MASSSNQNRNRLPTLHEVLSRKTRPPVDLYCFYLYLQREGAEDTLDFWLDVQQHENLCRAYFKDLRKSGRALKEDWPQYYELARRRGSIYNAINGITRQKLDELEKSHQEQQEQQDGNQLQQQQQQQQQHQRQHLDPRNFDPEKQPSSPREPPHDYQANLSPTMRALYPDENDGQTPPLSPAAPPGPEGQSPGGPGSDQDHLRQQSSSPNKVRASFTSKRSKGRDSPHAQPIIPRHSAITRTDLIASAERIYARYLLSGAEKEVYLPPSLRIHSFPLSSAQLPSPSGPDYEAEAEALARVPDMFHSQKEFIYRALEQDSFPRFLRAKAFGNLTPMSALVRLGFGLIALWAAFSTGFSFIFLNTLPKTKRLWVILPFSVAIYCLLAHSYEVDPILVYLGYSETMPFRTIKIRESYVRKLLLGRALWVTTLIILIVAILTIIFVAVPGRRL